MLRLITLSVFGTVLLGLAGRASASTVIAIDENTAGYTVLNNDLLQTSLASTNASTGFDQEGVVGVAALNDGGFGPQGGQNANPKPMAAATAGTNQVVTYTLDTSVNTHGYDITNVNSYAGWDGARYAQNYNLSFHIVGTPGGTFTSAISVNYQPDPINGSNNNTSALVSDTTGLIAGAVDQVRFTFLDAASVPAGGYQGYRELDVVGVATVPEPSSLALLGLSAIGLLAVARRRSR